MVEEKLQMQNDSVTPKEILSEHQPWIPKKEGIMLVEKAIEELGLPASRYRFPQTSFEKLAFSLQKKMVDLSGVGETFIFQDSFVPLQWRTIIQYLYDTGIIVSPEVQVDSLFNDEPKLYMLRLRASSVEGITDGGIELMGGGYSRGVSQDLDEAFSKVIGELLERYPLTIYRERELIRASVDDLKNKKQHFLDPFLIAGFSEAQKEKFPKRRFNEKSIFCWVEGKSLMSGGHALVPAQMVFWNYRHVPDEPFIQHPITNGAGGMFTLTEAVLSGLYELIQRDAFFVYWFNKIAPPRIDILSIKRPELKEILNSISRYGIRIEILNITSDLGIPAFLGVLVDPSGYCPAITVGGGCGPDPETAILRAVTEVIGVRHWLREQKIPFPQLPDSYEPFSIPLGQVERLLLWGNPKMRSAFDFFLKGKLVSLEECCFPVREVYEPKKELSELVDRFSKRGDAYEIFCYEAEHSILRELGYASVSVSVPALLPLYMNETCAPLEAGRIGESCRVLGYKPADKINPLPHPFP